MFVYPTMRRCSFGQEISTNFGKSWESENNTTVGRIFPPHRRLTSWKVLPPHRRLTSWNVLLLKFRYLKTVCSENQYSYFHSKGFYYISCLVMIKNGHLNEIRTCTLWWCNVTETYRLFFRLPENNNWVCDIWQYTCDRDGLHFRFPALGLASQSGIRPPTMFSTLQISFDRVSSEVKFFLGCSAFYLALQSSSRQHAAPSNNTLQLRNSKRDSIFRHTFQAWWVTI